MKTLLTCIILLTSHAASSQSDFAVSTGEDLRRTCNSADHFAECTSYLKVIYDTAKAIAQATATKSNLVVGSCGPEKGIDTVPLVVALRIAWQEYAGKHPDRLRHQAVNEVLQAFERKWPCPI